jgi:hypothetical protein
MLRLLGSTKCFHCARVCSLRGSLVNSNIYSTTITVDLYAVFYGLRQTLTKAN